MKELTLKQWKKRYKPLLSENGLILVFDFYNDLDIEKLVDEKKIWTFAIADNDIAITFGFWHANAIGYVVTTIPFNESGIYEDTCELSPRDYEKKFWFL